MSLEHNFYRTNEICYQGNAGQVYQLKIILSLTPANGLVQFRVIDFIISSFIKVLQEAVVSNQDKKNWVSVNADDRHFTIFLTFTSVLATSIKDGTTGQLFMHWCKETILYNWFR